MKSKWFKSLFVFCFSVYLHAGEIMVYEVVNLNHVKGSYLTKDDSHEGLFKLSSFPPVSEDNLKEIAKNCGVSHKKVKSAYQRSKKYMQDLLVDYERKKIGEDAYSTTGSYYRARVIEAGDWNVPYVAMIEIIDPKIEQHLFFYKKDLFGGCP